MANEEPRRKQRGIRSNRSNNRSKLRGINPIEIKAAVVRDKGGPFKIETLTLEEPRRNEVLVKIVASGMCHTDMVARDKVYDVPHPIVLGHEGAGIVEAVGEDVKEVAPVSPLTNSRSGVMTILASWWI